MFSASQIAKPMTRWLLLATLCGLADVSRAHFVFIVPVQDGEKARVVLSEDLEADAEVAMILGGSGGIPSARCCGKDLEFEVAKSQRR